MLRGASSRSKTGQRMSYFNPVERRVIATLFIINAVAKILVFSSNTPSVDDLFLWTSASDFDSGIISLRDGRFLVPFLSQLMHINGVHLPLSYSVGAAVFIACQCLSAIFVCRLWNVYDYVPMMLVGLVISLHPFQADFLVWKTSLLFGGLPFALSLLAIAMLKEKAAAFWVAVLLLLLMLGIHQLGFVFGLVALFVAMALELLSPSPISLKLIVRRYMPCFAALAVAFVIYAPLARLSMSFYPYPSLDRENLGALLDLPLLWLRLKTIVKLLVVDDSLTTLAHRAIAAIAVAMGIFLCLKQGTDRVWSIMLAALMAFLGFCASIGFTLVPNKWIPLYRVWWPTSLLMAAAFVISYRYLQIGLFRRTFVAIWLFLIFGFASRNSQVLAQQATSSERSAHLMNRIAVDLNREVGLSSFDRVIKIGSTSQPTNDLSFAIDVSKGWKLGVVLSPVSVPWPDYFATYYSFVTGQRVGYFTTPDERSSAMAMCAKSAFWPDSGSMHRIGRLAIICFGPAENANSPLDRSSVAAAR